MNDASGLVSLISGIYTKKMDTQRAMRSLGILLITFYLS